MRIPKPVTLFSCYRSEGGAKMCAAWLPKLHLHRIKQYDQHALRWDAEVITTQPIWPLPHEFSFLELFEEALVFLEQSIVRLDEGWYYAGTLRASISPESAHLILNLYVAYLLKDEEEE